MLPAVNIAVTLVAAVIAAGSSAVNIKARPGAMRDGAAELVVCTRFCSARQKKNALVAFTMVILTEESGTKACRAAPQMEDERAYLQTNGNI